MRILNAQQVDGWLEGRGLCSAASETGERGRGTHTLRQLSSHGSTLNHGKNIGMTKLMFMQLLFLDLDEYYMNHFHEGIFTGIRFNTQLETTNIWVSWTHIILTETWVLAMLPFKSPEPH